jgi:hypothetical protein
LLADPQIPFLPQVNKLDVGLPRSQLTEAELTFRLARRLVDPSFCPLLCALQDGSLFFLFAFFAAEIKIISLMMSPSLLFGVPVPSSIKNLI